MTWLSVNAMTSATYYRTYKGWIIAASQSGLQLHDCCQDTLNLKKKAEQSRRSWQGTVAQHSNFNSSGLSWSLLMAHPPAAALLLSTVAGDSVTLQEREREGSVEDRSWESSNWWRLESLYVGIGFWHRFLKARFGYFSGDITVQQLTPFMGML